jgi:hypothetical protein
MQRLIHAIHLKYHFIYVEDMLRGKLY